MQTLTDAPCCPICGHDGSQVLKQNSPIVEFLPAYIQAPRASRRQCDNCKTTYSPECEESL